MKLPTMRYGYVGHAQVMVISEGRLVKVVDNMRNGREWLEEPDVCFPFSVSMVIVDR